MHTEDDTFNALRRISFSDMKSRATKAKLAIMIGLENINLDELFSNNGWTREEYDAEVSALLKSTIINKSTSFNTGSPYTEYHA